MWERCHRDSAEGLLAFFFFSYLLLKKSSEVLIAEVGRDERCTNDPRSGGQPT